MSRSQFDVEAEKIAEHAPPSPIAPLKQSGSFSSPRTFATLDSIPTPILRLLTQLAPLLQLLAYVIKLINWEANNVCETLLLIAAYISICLWTSYMIMYGLPLGFMVYGVISWMNNRKRQKKTKNKSSEEGSQASLDVTLDNIKIVNGQIAQLQLWYADHQLDWQNNPSQARRKLQIGFVYVAPIWVVLCLFFGPSTLLAVLGVSWVILRSPWGRVSVFAIQKTAIVRHIVATLVGYLLAIEMALRGKKRVRTVREIIRRARKERGKALEKASTQTMPGDSSELVFKFEIYENQRWWLGVDWTSNMMPGERTPWTDSHNDPIPSKSAFHLPEPTTTVTEQNDEHIMTVKEWKWVEPDWWVDMKGLKEGLIDEDGWQYSNNAWKGATGKGGLKQFTRRRKWCRNAKLVETVSMKQSNNSTDRKRLNATKQASEES
ncbi:hypothetical protein K450DRAFT_220769 [Umbelopsis ramanniana AG]|uniref:Peroxin/Ferlin domain-containing protein n=1 Tax=Umbelopsis ramanniana AG TaxID=1314678 RepID=A0AAD5HGV3_UMBRA|nr:uncharacterized protein K450DRAFT_220769 [Umbelopsis ramanniana AG]KAI8583952.1 hypothetical protein K450DRAFT_220769 [Umbelopsis ramanniana AG]